MPREIKYIGYPDTHVMQPAAQARPFSFEVPWDKNLPYLHSPVSKLNRKSALCLHRQKNIQLKWNRREIYLAFQRPEILNIFISHNFAKLQTRYTHKSNYTRLAVQ